MQIFQGIFLKTRLGDGELPPKVFSKIFVLFTIPQTIADNIEELT
jgi:hypothetical protein